MLRGLKQTLCAPGPRDPSETETELCLSISSGGRSTIELQELTQDWEIALEKHKEDLVCTRTQEKGAGTPQKTDPDLPISVQDSLAEAWVGGGLLQGWEQ